MSIRTSLRPEFHRVQEAASFYESKTVIMLGAIQVCLTNPTHVLPPSVQLLVFMVSVIMPTYNRVKYFNEALESAVQQSFDDLEILITDNRSDSDKWEELSEIIDSVNDPRIRVRRNRKNVGPMKNFLAGVKEAEGKYIAALHDDDVWEPTFLERLIPPLEKHPNASLAFSDHYIINQHSEIKDQATEENTERWNRNSLSTGIYQPFCKIGLVDKSVPAQVAAVIRKSAIAWRDFSEKVGHADDLWLTYLACREGRGAYYVNERLTRYRSHDEMLTATSQPELHKGTKYCYEQFLSDSRLNFIHDKLINVYNDVIIHEAFRFLKKGKQEQALELFRSIISEGHSFKAWIGLVLSFMPKWFTIKLLSLR
jgi:glycosyltransferase involved in cell wall biosynthesis